MSVNHYEWKSGEPTNLHVHSLVKHQVIHDYLFRYIQVLAGRPQQDRLRLTVVDGFSGGGFYRVKETGCIAYGSPIQMLSAADEAVAWINANRVKTFALDAQFYFVDKDPGAIEALRFTLRDRGYDKDIGKRIHLLNQSFGDAAPGICRHIRERGAAGRAIFVLDQYGYTDVPLSQIASIFDCLPRSEVLLTIAADALFNFVGDTNAMRGALEKSELDRYIDLDSILEMKARGLATEFIVESKLIGGLVGGSNANHFTPFFITSKDSYRAYWLVHLSNHPRARDEMAKLHWEKQNVFAHHGKPGLCMLGYDPRADVDFTGGFDFGFDGNARERTKRALLDDLPNLLAPMDEGLSFAELMRTQCNQTPATSDIIQEVLLDLRDEKQIYITGEHGEKRNRTRRVSQRDVIRAHKQLILLPPWCGSPGQPGPRR